jgi:hypothetical protein
LLISNDVFLTDVDTQRRLHSHKIIVEMANTLFTNEIIEMRGACCCELPPKFKILGEMNPVFGDYCWNKAEHYVEKIYDLIVNIVLPSKSKLVLLNIGVNYSQQ